MLNRLLILSSFLSLCEAAAESNLYHQQLELFCICHWHYIWHYTSLSRNEVTLNDRSLYTVLIPWSFRWFGSVRALKLCVCQDKKVEVFPKNFDWANWITIEARNGSPIAPLQAVRSVSFEGLAKTSQIKSHPSVGARQAYGKQLLSRGIQ